MTRLRTILTAILLILTVQAGAQQVLPREHSSEPASSPDFSGRSLQQLTSNTVPQPEYSIGRKAGQIAVAGVPLIALGGVAALDADGGLKNLRDSWIPGFRNRTDDYLQYSPGVLMLSLRAAGVQGRSSTWGEMLTASAAAYVILGVSVNALKYTTSVERPDGADTHSFPSGHSATALMMAGLLTREYGSLSPWVGVGAYSLASVTGAMRIANNKHWLSDVLTGAGLGILSAEAGYLISDILFKKGFSGDDLSEDKTPSFFGLYTGTGWLRGTSSERTSHFGLEGAHFFNPWLGLGGRAVVSCAGASLGGPFAEDTAAGSSPGTSSASGAVSGDSNNFVSFSAGAYFSLPLCERFSLSTKALFGYYGECPAGDAISGGIDLGSGLDLGTGLSLNVRLRDHYGIRLFADYDSLASRNLLTLGFSVNALW